MSYRDTSAKLADYRRQISELRQQMRAVQATAEPEEVRDYELGAPNGVVRLSKLFGDKQVSIDCAAADFATGCAPDRRLSGSSRHPKILRGRTLSDDSTC